MKQVWTGTYTSTDGLQQTTGLNRPLVLRLVGFAIAVALVALVILRIDTNIWRQQARLGEGFAAIKAEKFYFGVNFRVNLRKLTATILDCRLTGDAQDLEAFRREAGELNRWLAAKSSSFISPSEQVAFKHLERAYSQFLARVDPKHSTSSLPPPGREDFAAAYAQIRHDDRLVLRACDEVVDAEHSGFDLFIEDSYRTLHALQRLFLVSLWLLLALAGALAILVYRGMLAPLRARLSESESIIERQEKLAALGALGAGVAHEIRNPLTAIKFRLFSLKKSLPPALANSPDASVLSEEITRLDRIVKEFLQFARPAEPHLVRIPAGSILEEVHGLMKPALEPAGIELKLEASQPVWIKADTQQVKQVLINLIQNSADSIGRGGTIGLRLCRGAATLDRDEKPMAVLAVSDTGKGIAPEVQKRLFDPFFTTKEGGTGLGLAIAARIVEKHGGLLRFRTELDRGTLFEVLLPAADDYGSKTTTH